MEPGEFFKLCTIVLHASHDNRANIFTTTVFIYGGVNGIVANASSHTSFLSQYTDFACALNPVSLDCSFTASVDFKKSMYVIV